MCEKSGNLATRPAWDVWEKCVFGIVLLTGLALLGICVFFYDIPERDVALRYSPMADAFAAGNFRYAFHPRVPLLVPLLGGIVAKIVGCGGFMALKIVTALAFLGALFPLRGLMRRVFNDDKIAAVACGIYLLCPALMRLAYGGERDGIKSLIIVSIAYFLVRIQQKTDDFSAYAGFGFFCGIATLVRVELLLVSAVSLFWLFCLETRAARWPKRSFAALLIALLFPCIGGVVNYALFGVAAPDSYTEKIVTGILGRTNTFGEFCAVMPVGFSLFALTGAFFGRLRGKKILWAVLAVAVVLIAGCWLLGASGKMSLYYGFGKYAERFCKGFCGYYAILLIPGILLRLYDKKWTPADSLLFSFYCVHGVLLVSLTFVNLVFYISPRYLESAQPLMFGWCAYAIVRLWRMIPIIPIRAVGVAALAGLGIFCFRHSLKEIIPFFGDEEERAMRIAIFDFSDEIRSAREGGETPLCGDLVDFDLNEYHPPCATTIRYFHYSGGKWKSCAKRITVLSYFASVRTVGKNADYVCLILPKGIERPKMIGGKGANGKSNWRQLRRVPSEGYDYELWGSVR